MINDQAAATIQLDRPLRATGEVVARCHLALPVVMRVPPVLDDGTPFPTLYWLTCPLALRRIGRLESVGGVKQMERLLESDEALTAAFARRHESYAAERDALVPADAPLRPEGGVAGLRRGVKCLHAHYGDFAAGGDNPVGALVAPWVEPLDCARPCVVGDGADVAWNPAWREPK
ncbi:MAG TPA: DUF501 domain-containing protein [Acidimicrobiia bacterium]|nr:DUF501 domain-containing protein [Acidimicrobiia bacterium]